MPSIANNSSDLPLLWEQIRNCAGGMDAFSDPAELAPTASAKLINVLIRDKAKSRTRPGADGLGGAVLAAFPVKGLFYFDAYTGGTEFEQLIACCNQVFKFWNGATWTTMNGWTGTPANARIAMAQGVDTVLVSDGTNALRIWDGAGFSVRAQRIRPPRLQSFAGTRGACSPAAKRPHPTPSMSAIV